jgi:hypothetical protein
MRSGVDTDDQGSGMKILAAAKGIIEALMPRS